jgi:hypothetical protein
VLTEGLRSYGTAAKEHPKLLYNSTAYFIAMAIADNALFGIESLEDLQAFEIPTGEEGLILSFKESALERPILRQCTKEKGTTEKKMSEDAFLRIFRAVKQKEGYFDGASIHAVRRGLGKKIDGKSRSTEPFLAVASRRPAFTPVNWLTPWFRALY